MSTSKKKSKNHWIGNTIGIIVFLLLPGIRGYQNLQWYEYLLFVFGPVAYLIYDMVHKPKKDA